MQTATSDPLVGRALEGRYRIRSRIARGGMSTVYAALDERLDRSVAVKVMADSLSADPAFNDRFAREARAAARLAHTNAVAVYDQGTDGGHVFLVMELVSGRTLRDLIHERRRLNPAEAVSILEPVLGALAAAHQAGLVHRDVKPENILLSDEGVVKVADFGLARAVETGDAATRTGMMMGTVAYCSPEQITRGRTDQRSDVYSAGIVLYELLTGHPPYTGDSAVAVAYQHVHNQVPPPSSVVAGIPPELDDLVQRATEREPGGRPLDAGAFLAQLSDVRADLALPIVGVPLRPRPQPRSEASPAATRTTATVQSTERIGSGSGRHDTLVEPSSPATRHREPEPPPPVVTPPGQRPRPVRRHRLRRTLVGLLVVLLVGSAVSVGSWWLVAGRYTRVPHVEGQSQILADNALRRAGFHVGNSVQSRFDEAVAKGSVLSTSPGGGERERRGTTVGLILSLGPERFSVPSVAGDTPTQARAAFGTLPVVITNQSQNSDTVATGTVIGTNPPAGGQVKRDQTVIILVSSGPAAVAVPNVVNQAQAAASAALTRAGFKVAAVEDYSDSIAAGSVISQDPVAATSLTKFQTVTITVSKGPEFVTVPSVSGKSASAARAALEAVGLKVKVKRVFGGLLNITVGLDRPGGDDVNSSGQVRKGATVTIEVA